MKQADTYVWVSDNYEQSLKDELKKVSKEKRRKKMKKQLKKAKLMGKAFGVGFKANALDERTLGVSTIVGFSQGLKYKGSLKRGFLTGAITLGVTSTIGGVLTVFNNLSTINNLLKEDE